MTARTTYRWLSLDLDYRAFRESDLGLARWLGSLLASPKLYALFGWSDPMPFIVAVRDAATRLPPRLIRRVRQWLSTAY
jgi:hypothetical protein